MIEINRYFDKVKVVIDGKTYYFNTFTTNIIPSKDNPDYVLLTDFFIQKERFALNIPWKNLPWQPATIEEALNELARIFADFKEDYTQFLSDDVGTINFNGDYSVTPKKAFIMPPLDRTLYINRLVVFIADSGSVNAGYYGNSLVLTNGIKGYIEDVNGNIIKDFTAGMTLKTNADWAKLGFQVSDISFGSVLNYVHAVLSFYKNGTPLRVNQGEKFIIELSDDFSALTEHTFRAGAYLI